MRINGLVPRFRIALSFAGLIFFGGCNGNGNGYPGTAKQDRLAIIKTVVKCTYADGSDERQIEVEYAEGLYEVFFRTSAERSSLGEAALTKPTGQLQFDGVDVVLRLDQPPAGTATYTNLAGEVRIVGDTPVDRTDLVCEIENSWYLSLEE